VVVVVEEEEQEKEEGEGYESCPILIAVVSMMSATIQFLSLPCR